MTEPQGMDPSAQIAPQHMVKSLQRRVSNLTEENVILDAFNEQLISHIKELEQRLEAEQQQNNKESDGSGPPPPDPEPPSGTIQDTRNGSDRGPSPADVARRARTRGGQ